ncbi:hypothetical protein [Phenylobacterium sp.]|jgi:hypothetical protein|uniref:hypothetical protein n=1 Tax=Phenylobacterium sp. TaxID=1871053 RepID=UPI0012196293|nr:hypothetical protein [Phenylobacterium sp.]THD50954.1 MAG: hypothetical protein E8A12_21740 [Phenylobacterium sp.]
MEIHKPKAARSWREFAVEIGTIVIGVLIALAAEQIVEAIHNRHVAEEARDNVRAEARLDLGFIAGRLAAESCVEQRLEGLQSLLAETGDGAPKLRIGWVGHPPTTPMFSARWTSATASGRTSLFSAAEQDRYGGLYGLFTRFDEHQLREQAAWTQLRMLETWRGPLGPAARLEFAKALQDARYEAWDLRYGGSYALTQAKALGLKPATDGTDESHPPICLPISMPRAEVLRQIKAPFGEP